ncbi:MAG: hypothetical protein ACRENL_11685 [Candidatus Dormibacteria bacterium]
MSAQLAAPRDTDLLAQAGREIWERRMAALRNRLDTSRIRHRITAIDSLINLLEERHLTGERSFDRILRQRLYRLEHEVGVPLPRKAVRARNTVRLHAALLDWQETLFDAMVPERMRYPDAHDSDWSTPTPQGW